MKRTRKIATILERQPTLEGAGVRLKRVFGFSEVPGLDPFLLLDDFSSKHEQDYLAGFPWHPHRGIETVTYLIHGEIEHGDSLGNGGVIGAGDVQWMSAGSGIIHQEMPQRSPGGLQGYQLWVNLPASLKMSAPRYRGITARQIPEVKPDTHTLIKVIAGEVNGTRGPAKDIAGDPEYLDVAVGPGATFERNAPAGQTVFAYVIAGTAVFAPGADPLTEGQLALYADGDHVKIVAGEQGARFLFLRGKPLKEPVAWRGPIVMNTDEELETAFEEYRNGTFIKTR